MAVQMIEPQIAQVVPEEQVVAEKVEERTEPLQMQQPTLVAVVVVDTSQAVVHLEMVVLALLLLLIQPTMHRLGLLILV